MKNLANDYALWAIIQAHIARDLSRLASEMSACHFESNVIFRTHLFPQNEPIRELLSDTLEIENLELTDLYESAECFIEIKTWDCIDPKEDTFIHIWLCFEETTHDLQFTVSRYNGPYDRFNEGDTFPMDQYWQVMGCIEDIRDFIMPEVEGL